MVEFEIEFEDLTNKRYISYPILQAKGKVRREKTETSLPGPRFRPLGFYMTPI